MNWKLFSKFIVLLFCPFISLFLLSISSSSQISHILPSVKPKVLYYVSTQEGLIAHLRYIQMISYMSRYYNRSVILASFTSTHYPDISIINICDYFDFPSHISCTTQLGIEILESKTCVYTGYSRFNNDSGIPRHMKLKRTNNFTYDHIDCLAGQVLYHSGIFDRNKITHSMIASEGFFRIKPKYSLLLKEAKMVLGIGKNIPYAVTHWRRGDELLRCSIIKNESINCGTADDLIRQYELNLKKHGKNNYNESMIKYVATNENNREILEYLRKHHLKLYSDLESSNKLHLANSLVRFMVELMLMCDATYYESWGHTLVFHYVDYCRRQLWKDRHRKNGVGDGGGSSKVGKIG